MSVFCQFFRFSLKIQKSPNFSSFQQLKFFCQTLKYLVLDEKPQELLKKNITENENFCFLLCFCYLFLWKTKPHKHFTISSSPSQDLLDTTQTHSNRQLLPWGVYNLNRKWTGEKWHHPYFIDGENESLEIKWLAQCHLIWTQGFKLRDPWTQGQGFEPRSPKAQPHAIKRRSNFLAGRISLSWIEFALGLLPLSSGKGILGNSPPDFQSYQ